jgi:hypothetical protein
MNRRTSEASQRFAERRRREDEAQRLSAIAPTLETLRLEIAEGRSTSVNPDLSHVRKVVVENAPALFILPCGDSSCRDGGHDVTNGILRSLRERSTRFEGEDGCSGHVGTASCSRVLRYVGIATYKE